MSNAFRIRHSQPNILDHANFPSNAPIAIIGADDSYSIPSRAFDAKIVESPNPAFRHAVMTSDGTIYGQKHGTRYKIGQQR